MFVFSEVNVTKYHVDEMAAPSIKEETQTPTQILGKKKNNTHHADSRNKITRTKS